MKFKPLLFASLIAASLSGYANPVTVKMNAVSTTMTLAEKETGALVALPAPVNKEYNLDLAPGEYILSGFANNGKILNGTILLSVADVADTQTFPVITCTAYVSNKNSDGSQWSTDNGDYQLDVKLCTRDGDEIATTPGKSATANRCTFLALNGNSYNAAFKPSEAHAQEGYMTLYKGGTLTANANVTGAIPVGGAFAISVPDGAELQLGMKFTHFTDFTAVEPDSIVASGAGKVYNYTLANGQVYNYRTWKHGGLTHGGYFTMNTADASKLPEIAFADADYAKHDPKAINHSPLSNKGYETGDLLLNINPSHHLRLSPGEEFLVHGMRMWELSDNSTNNYFFEPDFHYTVLGADFAPSTDVIEIENADTRASAWSKIKAKGAGTAIVLVTYDGINLNYYSNADKKEYLGGEYWGAIWPENTGVFVVTVGQAESAAAPNMIVNEKYNMDALRLAGNNVDAEHDVFYYLSEDEGFPFTFTPEGVASVAIASPEISDNKAKYSGFTADGVVKNEDNSYTVLLKEGRNIVRMTDAAGNSAYQILRAKPCHREIVNETRPGSKIFQPGDKVKVQYSGLYHPANKIAGIYNMSAYITYNGNPNGSSLILGSGQYTFGSSASAQAVTIDIPEDYDAAEQPLLAMNEGVIQVNGFGDPIGNHRNISPLAGRSPNFNAVAHKTYFGAIPDIKLSISPARFFNISLQGAPDEAEVTLVFNGTPLSPDSLGCYSGTYGSYSLTATAEGYKCFRQIFNIGDDSDDNVVFTVDMELLGNAWDGKTKTEPAKSEDGVYQIATGAELAWFADNANQNGGTQDAALLNDIELGNFDWAPIGTASKKYSGTFSGNGHTISEIYISHNSNYKGLFGYVADASISGLTVKGNVAGKQYVGGLAGCIVGESSVDRCANYCNVSGTGTYAGGIVGYLNSAKASLTNCYNAGAISGTTNCGGVAGSNNASATMANIFNVGEVKGTTVGACVGGTTAKTNLSNAFAINEYQITVNQTKVDSAQMASGEIAYKLGEAFFQTIGQDPYPAFAGLKVYYDDEADEYYNMATGFAIDFGEGNEDVAIADSAVVMHVKDAYTLSAIATPAEARLPEISWQSSNEEVATVDNEGNVSAVGKGEALITASATIGDEAISQSCSVKVIGALVTTLAIGQDEITLDVNENPTAAIAATFGPDYADEPQVVWTLSDEGIAEIAETDGLSISVKALAAGDVTLKVEHADNPELFATCLIHVTNLASIADIESDGLFDIFDLSGRVIKLSATKEYLRNLQPGLYIVKTGDKVQEVIIK